ncbi:putative germin-like protein 2-1 [Tanacetum coccineum]
MIKPGFLLVGLLLATCSLLSLAFDPSPLQDFCVADRNSKVLENGFACKDPKMVKADDFLFKGIREMGNTTNAVGSNVTTVNVDIFPGLNTLGISLERIDYAPCGLNTPHYHPRATEVLTVIKGSLQVGFITTNPDNKFFTKRLKKGDVFIFPKALIHFQQNVGNGYALALSSLNSQNPGVVTIANAVFGSNPDISDDTLAKAFQVDKKVICEIQYIGLVDTTSVALSYVYYIPSLTINLASVSQICDFRCDVKFSVTDCSIYDRKTHDLVGTGVLGKLDAHDIFDCSGCKLAKFSALPFSNSVSSSNAPFDLTSCTDTPQQNDVAERKHRHLVETARSFLLYVVVPSVLWGESVLTATYVINIIPTAHNSSFSPFEKSYGALPDYSSLSSVKSCIHLAISYYSVPASSHNLTQSKLIKVDPFDDVTHEPLPFVARNNITCSRSTSKTTETTPEITPETTPDTIPETTTSTEIVVDPPPSG